MMNTEKTNNQIDPLANLSKEDLIKIIANMHDTIQEWHHGWGLNKEEAQTFTKVGNTCTQYCIQNNNWDISHL